MKIIITICLLIISIYSQNVPDSIVVLKQDDSTVVFSDTLSGYGLDTNGGRFYMVQLLDAFGAPIPENSPEYYRIIIGTEGKGIDEKNMSMFGGRTFVYDARGSSTWGNGKINVSYNGNTDTLKYSFDIFVFPVIQIVSISTHEWIGDTGNNVSEVEFVLDSVLGIDPDSLWAAYTDTGSRNHVYIEKLVEYGYKPYRDGFLDFLNITLSDSFELTEEMISLISFMPNTYNTLDSVCWLLSDSNRTIKIMPLGSSNNEYQLWLIPNSLRQSDSTPLETGFLPCISFNNELIIIKDTISAYPVLIGDGSKIYTTDLSLTIDSASPVISRFLFQNNACNPNTIDNKFRIFFSEPISYGNFPSYRQITAFKIINGSYQDSTFMSTSLLSGRRKDIIYNPMEAWNYANEPNKMMIYEAVVNPGSDSKFRPNVTKIKFTNDSFNIQLTDMNGNSACKGASKPVILENDPFYTPYVCNIISGSPPTLYNGEGYDISMNYKYNVSDTIYMQFMDFVIIDDCIVTLDEDGVQEENRIMDLGDTLFNFVAEAPETGYSSRFCLGDNGSTDELFVNTFIVRTRENHYAKIFIKLINTDSLNNIELIKFFCVYQNDGSRTLISIEETAEQEENIDFVLNVNPNPFNAQTFIGFGVPNKASVTLILYDIAGREVAALVKQKIVYGQQRAAFNGTRLPSGIYYIRLTTENKVLMKRAVLIK